MQNGILVLSLMAIVAMLLALGGAHSTSVNAYFNVMNVSVGINQNVFFNFSGDFPQSTSYTIYLGNVSVLSGTIPANSAQTYIAKYNVTNTMYGSYPSHIVFSALVSPLMSNSNVFILPTPNFGFASHSDYTYAFNRSKVINNVTATVLQANLVLDLINTGNTPLNITWSLPSVKDVLFSLDYIESFGIEPGGSFKIPVNMTLQSRSSTVVNFSFSADFGSQYITRDYTTTLISPIINMTFFNATLKQINSNESLFTVMLINHNNVPINLTLSFVLDVNGGDVFYNVSKVVSTSTMSFSAVIPNSRLVSVAAFYPSQNGTILSSNIYSNPVPSTPQSLLSVLAEYSYVIVLVIAIVILVLIHIRSMRKGGVKNDKKI